MQQVRFCNPLFLLASGTPFSVQLSDFCVTFVGMVGGLESYADIEIVGICFGIIKLRSFIITKVFFNNYKTRIEDVYGI